MVIAFKKKPRIIHVATKFESVRLFANIYATEPFSAEKHFEIPHSRLKKPK